METINPKTDKLSVKFRTTITGAIVQYIARDMCPESTVEGAGFRHLLNTPEPSYVVPSCKIVKTMLEDKQKSVKGSLLGKLSSTPIVAITTDFWSSILPYSGLHATTYQMTGSFKVSFCKQKNAKVSQCNQCHRSTPNCCR